MFEFLSSPFGLVAVGLGVLAVAVLALCFWITTLDRRMRGMADGLEAERRKVAEMQMVIGRRNNAARSYGGGRGRAAAPAGAEAPRAAAPVDRGGYPVGAQAGAGPAGRPAGVGGTAPRGAAPAAQPAPGVPAQGDVEAWVQGSMMGQQPIVIPDKKMSRKARREAERAFAARAAAELEARAARRAQEAAAAQRVGAAAPRGAHPYGGAVPTGRPAAAGVRPMRGTAVPRAAAPATGVPVNPAGAVAPGRGRHAR